MLHPRRRASRPDPSYLRELGVQTKSEVGEKGDIPARKSISLLGGDWTEENRLCGWLNFNVHTFVGTLILDLFCQGRRYVERGRWIALLAT